MLLRAVKLTIKGLVHLKSLHKHKTFKIYNSSGRIMLLKLTIGHYFSEKIFQKRRKCVAISGVCLCVGGRGQTRAWDIIRT